MQQQQIMSSVSTISPPQSSGTAIPSTIQWMVGPPQQLQPSKYTYPSRQSLLLGVILIISGVLSVVFNIVDLAVWTNIEYYVSFGLVGHGFWSGLMSLTAGILGVVAGRKRTTCTIRASMVLSILAASFSLGQLIVAIRGATILGATLEDFHSNCCSGHCDYYSYYYRYHKDDDHEYSLCRKVKTLIAMESLLAILSLVGGICAIVLSALACKAACCCCSTQTVVYSGQPVFMQNGVPVISQQLHQGIPMVGYPVIQHPSAAYDQPVGDFQFPTPPPSYNPPSSTENDEDKRQLV